MSNLKKIVFSIFLAVSLVAAAWAYLSLKKLKSPKTEAITAMPDACDFYMNTSDFYELSNRINSQSLIIDKLKGFKEVKEACDLLQQFDSVFNNQELLKEELKDNLIHFAFYDHYKNWLLCFNTLQSGNQDKVLHQLHMVMGQTMKKDQYFISKLNGNKNIYFNLINGIVCFSNSENIIKKSANEKEPKFFQSIAYLNFKGTLNESALCNVFFNTTLSEKNQSSKTNQTKHFFDAGLFAGSLVLEPSEIKINGNLSVDSNHVLAAMVNQEPQSTEVFSSILPYNTHYFEAYGFVSYPGFKLKLNKIKKDSAQLFWHDKNEKALYNLENEFNENLAGQLVQFECGLDNEKFIVSGIKDTLKALEHLKLLADSIVNTKNQIIYKLNAKALPALFQPLFNLKLSYMALRGNFLYFGNSESNLEQVLQDIDRNQTLQTNEGFLRYRNENFADDYNYLVYCSPRIYNKVLTKHLNFKISGEQNPFENLRHFSYSVVNGKNTLKFRLQLYNQAENVGNDQNALWTFNMDSISDSGMYPFINHLTNENEIIIQDEKNSLYLINAKGSQIWKKRLDEKIMSPVYMVDIYNNNKYQMLFNTADYLHLIDRNGHEVNGYPVKLPAKATSPLSLLDYNQDKNYRIFIACNNNLIYDINETGELQEGFVPVKTEKPVKLPVQYFKVGSNEYLVALDVEGKIYTFGRKGQTKIALKNRSIQNCKGFYINSTNNLASSSLIYYDDKNSLINKVNFIDKKDVVKLNIESGLATNCFNLVDDNREADLVISLNKQVYAFNLSGDLLHDFKTSNRIDQAFYYGDESNSVFCCLDKTQSELEIYDVQKQKIKKLKSVNLPLIVDLFNDKKRYMIVNYGNQLSCVALN